MSNTTELSHTEARELVERIADKYGRLSDSGRGATPSGALRAIVNPQTALGAVARTYVYLLFWYRSLSMVLKFCVVWQRILTKVKRDLYSN